MEEKAENIVAEKIMARYLLIKITNVIDKNPYYCQNKFPHVDA